MPIKIIVGNVTEIECDAIVNFYLGHLGQDSPISKEVHKLGGNKLLEECQSNGACFVGDSIITNAFGLKAKYIIHTVAPIQYEDFEHKLARCYKSAFVLGLKNELSSIAYPLITSDVFSISIEKAAKIALNRIVANLSRINERVFVCLVVPDLDTLDIVLQVAKDIVPEMYYANETLPLSQLQEDEINVVNTLQSALLNNYEMLRGVVSPKQIGEELFDQWRTCLHELYVEAVRLKNEPWNNLSELHAIASGSKVWDIFRVI